MANFEGFKNWSTGVAALAVPIIVAVIGNMYTSAIKERETQAKFVELAINILSTEPTDETKSLRSWAIKVIDEYSKIPLSKEAGKSVLESVPVPGNRSSETSYLMGTYYELMLIELGYKFDGGSVYGKKKSYYDFQVDNGLVPTGYRRGGRVAEGAPLLREYTA